MRKLVRSNARLASLGVLLALSPLFSSASGAAGLAPMSAPTASTVPLSHSTRGAVSGISYSGSSAGTNLNLSSSKANQSASNSSPVVITLGGSIGHGTILGGTNVVVSPGQLITPAEYAAVMQTLRGNQSLLLNTVGAAVGGSLTLNSKYVNDISSLLVPKNVSLDAVGYTSANPLNVKGTLADFGSIFALQNTANAGAVFDAANLAIGRGAVLSGSLPTGGDYKGSFASSDLTLNVSPLSASGNFVNNGSLLSNGNITVTAGGSIQNSTSGIIISAGQNVNISAGQGIVNNSGLVQSSKNITLGTLSDSTNLDVNATNGTFRALNGDINFRDATFNGTGGISVVGGNCLSQNVNFNAGTGAVNAVLGEVTGTVNATAGSAHILADTSKLLLGNTNVNGDPTYVNAGGDIEIVGTDVETADLAIIASGNITANGAAQIVDNGHNVWLIAGATVSLTNATCSSCSSSGGLTVPPGSASAVSGGFVQVSASGAGGGNIDLQTGNTLGSGNTVIDTSGTAGGAGGNVYLVALSNGSTGGQVLFPSTSGVSSINTSGNGAGNNGNVTIVSGASNAQAVSLGGIVTNGGTGQPGNVSISAAQSSFTGGAGGCSNCISFDASGTATGQLSTLSSVASSVTIASAINASGAVSILSIGGSVAVNAVVTGASVALEADAGNITGSGLITASSTTLTCPTGNINLTNLATPNVTVVQSTTGAGSVTLVDSVAITGNGVTTAGTGGFSLADSAVGGMHTTSSITSGGPIVLQTNASAAPLTIAGAVTGTNISILGAGGLITINNVNVTGTSVSLDPGSNGTVTGNGLISGTTSVTLGSVGGNAQFGYSYFSLSLATPYLTFNTSGTVSLADSVAITGNGISTAGSVTLQDNGLGGIILTNVITASNTISLSTDIYDPNAAGIVVSSAGLFAPTISLTAYPSISTATIVLNGPLSGSTVTLDGAVEINSGSSLTATTATLQYLVSSAVPVSVSNLTYGGAPLIDLVAVTVNSSSTSNILPESVLNLKDPQAITVGTSRVSFSSLTLNSDNITVQQSFESDSTTFLGYTPNGTAAAGTGMNVTLESGIAPLGTFTIQSAPGQDLTISGSRDFTGSANAYIYSGGTVNFIATDTATNHPTLTLASAGISIIASNTNFTAPNVVIEPDVVYQFPADYSHVAFNTGNLSGNPGQMQLHNAFGTSAQVFSLYAYANAHSVLQVNSLSYQGITIANSTGPVDLSQISSLNLANSSSPLAIIAATNITNNSGNPITINLSGGVGGFLTLVAGYNFTPSTSGQQGQSGTNNTEYTFTNVTAGGFISLGTLSIDTSGAQAGGNVTVIAARGSVNNGSVSLGSINASSSLGLAGSVAIYGDGIAVGAINANSGTVPLASIYQPNVNIGSVSALATFPVTYYVQNGMVYVHYFVNNGVQDAVNPFPYIVRNNVPNLSGLVSVSSIQASQSQVYIAGSSLSASGLISAPLINLNAVAGNLLSLQTESSNLTATATGSISINNLADLPSSSTSVIVNAGTAAAVTNVGIAGSPLNLGVSGTSASVFLSGVSNAVAISSISLGTPKNALSITANSLTVTGAIDAGSSGTVSVQPTANSDALVINSGSTLSNVTAGSFVIGSNTNSGGIVFNGNVSLGGSGSSLQIVQGAGGFTNNGTLAVAGPISVSVGGILTTGNMNISYATTPLSLVAGSIIVNGALTSTGTLNLTSSASAGITGGGSISAPSISFSSTGGGNIGPLSVAAPYFAINQPSTGAVNLTDSVALTGNGASTVGNGGFVFTDTASGGIALSGAITTSGTFQLIDTGTNASVSLGANVNAASALIQASGSGQIVQTAGTISGQAVSLISGAGDITNITTATPTLLVNTSGNVGITNVGSATTNLSSGGATFSSLNVASDGALTVTSSLSASGALTLSTLANNGSVQIGANNLSASSITISTSGTGLISSTTGVLSGTSLVSLSSTVGNIQVLTLTPALNLNTSGAVVIQNLSNGALSLSVGNSNPASVSVSSNGDLLVSSLINAANVSLASVNGNILLSSASPSSPIISTSAAGSIVLRANDSISATSGILQTANLVANSGTGSIAISNTNATYLNLSAANGDITVLDSAVNTGNSVIAQANSSVGNVSIATNGPGTILEVNYIGGGNLTLNSTGGPVNIDTGATSSAANSITISGASVTFGVALSRTLPVIPGVSVGTSSNSGNQIMAATGAFIVNSDQTTVLPGASISGGTLSINGQTANGTFSNSASMLLNNQGSILATAGGITVSGASGQDVGIVPGQMIVPAGQSVNVTASSSVARDANLIVSGSGNIAFSGIGGGAVNFSATGSTSSVTLTAGSNIVFPDDYTAVNVNVGSSFYGDPSEFVLHTAQAPNPNSTLTITGQTISGSGTIANSAGSVDLSQVSSLNFHGQNIAIIASADIINSSGNQLLIDTSSPLNGGNLVLLAGFNFNPSTTQSQAPVLGTFTITGASETGGSISLGNVNINASGGVNGGDVSLLSNSGTVSNGSITIGNVSSTGSVGSGGTISVIGNGITFGALSVVGNQNVSGGSITLASALSVQMPSSPVQIVNGALVGAALQPGATAGTVTLSGSLLAGANGAVNISAQNITSNSSISGGSFNLRAGNFASAINGAITLGASSSILATGEIQLGSNSIILSAGGTISGGTVVLNGLTPGGSATGGNSFNIGSSGTISSTLGGITITSAGGQDLSISGASSGEFLVPAGQSITIQAPAGSRPAEVTIGSSSSVVNFGNPANLSGAMLSLQASGNISANAAAVVVNAVSGGNVALNLSGSENVLGSAAGAFVVSTLGSVALSGNVYGANGVSINSSGFDNQGYQVASNNAPISFVIAGINLSGTSSINAGTSAVTISSSMVNATSSAGTTSVPGTSGGTILLGGSASSGTQIPGGGFALSQSELNSISAGTLVLGSTLMNGGVIVQSNLNITPNYNLQIIQGSVTEQTSLVQAGGAVVNGTQVINGGFNANGFIIALAGSLHVDVAGAVSVAALSTSNPDGAVVLQTTKSGSGITLNSGLPSAHVIGLLSSGTLAGLSVNSTITPAQDSGNGGSVFLSASNLASLNLTLNVSGTGTGNGGTASFSNLATSPISTSNLHILANGASAGAVSISTLGNLTITDEVTAAPTATNGTGASLSYTATGNLLVSGNLNANGGTNGAGGNISLNSENANPLQIGLASTINGVRGALSVAGGLSNGTISISDSVGSVYTYQNLNHVADISISTSSSAAGSIFVNAPIGDANTALIGLTAGGIGNVAGGTSKVTAADVALTTKTGSIGAVSPILTVTSSLQANAGGTSSVVNLSNVVPSGGALNLLPSSAGSMLSLSSTGSSIITSTLSAGNSVLIKSLGVSASTAANIVIGGNVSASNLNSGSISLSAANGGSINGSNSGSVKAQAVILNTTGTGAIGNSSSFKLSAASLQANSTGAISLSNTSFNNIALVVSSLTPTTGAFSLVANSAVSVTTGLTRASSLSIDTSEGAGGITVSAIGSSNTSAINLTTSTGAILSTGAATTESTGSVNLTTSSGNIGTTQSFQVNTKNLSVNGTAGSININDVSTASSASPIQIGGLSSSSNITIAASGTLSLNGNISAAGDVKITTSGNGITNAGEIRAASGVSLVCTNPGVIGSIIIGGNITAANSNGVINLTASGSGTLNESGSSTYVEANAVNLATANARSIGNSEVFNFAAASLNESSTGSVNFSNLGFNPGAAPSSSGQTLTVSGGSPVNASYSLISATSVNLNTTLSTAKSIVIDTSSAEGSITLSGAALGGVSSTSSVTLTSSSGNISGNAIINTTSSGSFTVNTSSGNLGTASSALKINSPSITMIGQSTSINLSALSNLATSVTGLSSAGNINFSSNATTTFNGLVSGATLTLKLGGTGVNFSTVIVAQTAIIEPLNPSTPINIAGGTSGFRLSADNFDGLNVANLVFGSSSETGGININSALNPSSSYSLQFVEGAGSFNSSAGAISLLEGNLSVSLGAANIKTGAISAAASNAVVSLSNTGVGTIDSNGVIAANTVSLNAGAGVSPISIDAANLAASSGGTGALSVTDTSSSAIAVGTLGAKTTITFSTPNASSVFFGGNISSGAVTLNTAGNTLLNANVQALTGALTLNESGSGTTNFNASGSGNGQLSAATTLSLNTNGSTTFAASYSVLVNPQHLAFTGTNSLLVKASSGELTIGASDIFTAYGRSNATISLLEATDSAGDKIAIGNGANLSTTVISKSNIATTPLPGQISVVVGQSVPLQPVAGSAPLNVNVISGTKPALNTVYWGANAIDASASGVNNLQVKGNSAIVFSAGAAAGISLGGSTNFLADPPSTVIPAMSVVPILQGSSNASGNVLAVSGNGASRAQYSTEFSAPTLSFGGSASASSSVDTKLLGGTSIGNTSTGITSINNDSIACTSIATNEISSLSDAKSGSTPTAFINSHADTPDNLIPTLNAALASKGSHSFNKLSRSASAERAIELSEEVSFGTHLIASDTARHIKTRFGEVEISAGSLVLMIHSRNHLSIFNLADSHDGAVRVSVDGKIWSLPCGHHSTIAVGGRPSFAAANPNNAIGYRGMVETVTESGAKIYNAEFSIPSLISCTGELRVLFNSRDRVERQLAYQMIKTAAALSQIRQKREGFVQLKSTPFTAMATE